MAGCMARRRRELGLHSSNRRTYETPPIAKPAGFQLPEWARRDSRRNNGTPAYESPHVRSDHSEPHRGGQR
jgi:hypothetical protein